MMSSYNPTAEMYLRFNYHDSANALKAAEKSYNFYCSSKNPEAIRRKEILKVVVDDLKIIAGKP